MQERPNQTQPPLPPNLPQSLPPQPPAYAQPYAVPQPYVQPPVYPLTQPYGAPPNLFLRFLRLLLRRMLYGGVIAGRALRPYALSIVIVIVLIGIILFEAFLLVAPRLFQPNNQPVDTRVALLLPSSAIEDFLAAQRTYDAEKMWDTFSPRYQATLLDRGSSKATLAVQEENERSIGQKYLRYDYIGGLELNDGRKKFFYVITVESPRADMNGPISYIFTVDPDGKIVRIE